MTDRVFARDWWCRDKPQPVLEDQMDADTDTYRERLREWCGADVMARRILRAAVVEEFQERLEGIEMAREMCDRLEEFEALEQLKSRRRVVEEEGRR